jgi:hypothetical protein
MPAKRLNSLHHDHAIHIRGVDGPTDRAFAEICLGRSQAQAMRMIVDYYIRHAPDQRCKFAQERNKRLASN